MFGSKKTFSAIALALVTLATSAFANDRFDGYSLDQYKALTLEQRYSHIERSTEIRGNRCFSFFTGKEVPCRHVCDYERLIFARSYEEFHDWFSKQTHYHLGGYITIIEVTKWEGRFMDMRGQANQEFIYGYQDDCPGIRMKYERLFEDWKLQIRQLKGRPIRQ